MAVPATLDTVAVIGNGLIGHGMAQIFAAAGREVVMIGRRGESLAAAMEKIGKSLADFEAHGLIDAAGVAAATARIRTSTDLEDAAAAQLVLEAVPADRAVQDEVYGALDRICAPPAVIASGSGQPASDLVSNVRHRGRVIAAHFWYPPQLIPLVEVCAGPETDPDVAPWLCEVLRSAGKEPVIVEKEIPGFLGNRLQYALLREAWALWAEGVASAEAIDTVVKASIGRRLAISPAPSSRRTSAASIPCTPSVRISSPTFETTRSPPERSPISSRRGTAVSRPGAGSTTGAGATGRGSSPSARRSCSAISRATMPSATDIPTATVINSRPCLDGGGADAGIARYGADTACGPERKVEAPIRVRKAAARGPCCRCEFRGQRPGRA